MFCKFVDFIFANRFPKCSFEKKVLCGSVGSNISICNFVSRGKIVYIGISPHPAKARFILGVVVVE